MSNLVELFDNVVEFQNYNGVPLAAGKLYVFALGRTRLMDTWSDIDGESLNPNPIILDDLGQCHCYCSDDYDYTLVVCDQFDNEIFSVDKYLLSKGEHSHADVAVAPSEHIGVSSYHVGEVTVYVPYLTGEVGKVYEGIDPIVVNNDVNRISANHIPLGVQDPLYFVEDSETACIIGCSAQTEIPSALSSKWDEASDAVIANSAQWAEGTEYEAGSYIDIDGHTISVTGLQPDGDYAYNSALSSKLDVTATGQFLTGLPEDLVYTADITGLATTAQLDEKLDKSDSGNFYPMEGNPSGFLTAHQSLQGYATEQWVEDKGYLTGVDIPESATWNATTQTVSANSAQWAGGTANPQIPVTGINGIKISESSDKVVFEVSGDYYPGNNPSGFITGVDLSDYATTAQVAEKQDSLTFGYKDTAISSIDNSALYDNSAHARITTLAGRISDLSSNKLDVTAFSDVSGTFLTAHQDLSDYQTTAGMTAYQEAGDYYSASNPSGFITGVDLTPYQLTADMTAYQPTGDYLTTADSANFYTTANESGFISEVPAGTMNESAFEYDENDKISGYNGSAFAGGSDIPTGLYVPLSATVVAIGETSNSARWFSMVQGRQNTAQENSFAQGVTNSASAASLSQGYANTAYEDSFAQGHWNSAAGGSIAQGNSNSARNHSQAFGRGTVVTNTGMAIGNLNKTYTAAFVVGNGTSLSNRSDAFIINHDGSVSAAGKISANGVELGAGGEFPQSATEAVEYVTATSANIDSTIDNVSANSGVWGGSALPISAGPGIKFDMVDGTLVASTDETVLWSGNVNASHMPVNLSEPLSSFDKIGFTYKVWDNEWAYCEVPSLTEKYILYSNWIDNSQGGYSFAYKLSANSDKTQLGFQRSMFAAWGSTTTSQSSGGFALQKVVGINRIAGGN